MITDFPFLHSDYLGLLESSGAVSAATGWEPCHQTLTDGFLPLYRKNHSFGEYVFDQGWAQAWQRHGRPYYPKLLSAIPFTPVSGPRWRGTVALPALAALVREQLASEKLSSWHLLFVEPEQVAIGETLGLIPRAACHFEWRNPGYGDFQDFLAQLKAAKRKNMRKERQRVNEQPLTIKTRALSEVPAAEWQVFYECYAMTYHVRGRHPYLPWSFFEGLAQSVLAAQVTLISAHDEQGMFAGALFFHDQHKLYGRYWGSLREVSGLHFELCFYRGMELCIQLGLGAFDPGVQGEHKLLRGFEPVLRWSLHEIRELDFRDAVRHFCREEQQHVEDYARQAREFLPFRQPD